MERDMANDRNPLSPRNNKSDINLTTLKRQRTTLRKRKRNLEGARAYLGERADSELFNELAFVTQQLQQIEEAIQDVQVPQADTESVHRLYVEPNALEIEYVPFEEGGTIELHYSGTTPSLIDFCAFNVALDKLVNKVASTLVFDSIRREELSREIRNQIVRDQVQAQYVSTRIVSLRIGSFDEVFSFAILPLLAHPDVRSILQSLAANVIWILGERIGRVVRGRLPKPSPAIALLEIEQYIQDAFAVVSKHQGGSMDIHIVHEIPNREKFEMTVSVNENIRQHIDAAPAVKQISPTKREPKQIRTTR